MNFITLVDFLLYVQVMFRIRVEKPVRREVSVVGQVAVRVLSFETRSLPSFYISEYLS